MADCGLVRDVAAKVQLAAGEAVLSRADALFAQAERLPTSRRSLMVGCAANDSPLSPVRTGTACAHAPLGA
jgi:hypothetical protein